MSEFKTVVLENDPRGFSTLWLNRPEKNNAFNAEMIAESLAALTAAQRDRQLRFLLVRGRGRHFSAGADLAWMQQSAGLDYQANLADAHELAELMYRLHAFPAPTLAIVQGAAFGGALGLVACCDMAIGTHSAQLSLSEVRIGLAPAVISPFVVQAIGARAARRYALTAERFSGERARELGLFAECHSEMALEEALQRWVEALLLNSPAAMRASKALLRDIGGGAMSPELRRRTEEVIAGIRISEEGQEGLRAFLEKRAPAWQPSVRSSGARNA